MAVYFNGQKVGMALCIVGGLKKYHIVQTIDGDTCTLAITDFTDQENNNYMATSVAQPSNKQKLYIIDE